MSLRNKNDRKATNQSSSSTVNRRNGQIGSFHLPHLHRIKPYFRFVLAVVSVVWLGFLDDMLAEERAVLLQVAVREPRSNLHRRQASESRKLNPQKKF